MAAHKNPGEQKHQRDQDRARRLYLENRMDEARALCLSLEAADPDCALALHLLALLDSRRGLMAPAIARLRRAVTVEPASAGLWADLGMMLAKTGDPEAEETLRQALKRQPGFPNAHYHLGELARKRGDAVSANEHYQEGLKFQPNHYPCRVALAELQEESGRHDRARVLLEACCEINPREPDAWIRLAKNLARDYPANRARVQGALKMAVDLDPRRELTWQAALHIAYAANDREAGARYCREWLSHCPGLAEAEHRLASFQDTGDTMSRASDAYVREHFDKFAGAFDQNLAKLGYHTPLLLSEELTARLKEHGVTRVASLLDAGCGTGLSGSFLRPMTGRLEGVDLSPGMLDRARERNLYDDLHEGEITAWLAGGSAPFDAIACADTLVYFGDLGPVLAAFHRRLQPGGWLVFSTESLEDPGPWRLNPSGRFSHTGDYVQACLAAAGFDEVRHRGIDLRKELQSMVRGRIYSARKPLQ
jgi:predicted TPR repeat methyltransferase